jgi:hypothetical protein|nr:MAG TPA: hypothetical protein [Caudoviricetes sp.]
MSEKTIIKGYKVFNHDWTCRGFQYEVGKTFKHDGNIEMCGAGFHFCQKASDCFDYYRFDSRNKVAEVEAIGLVETSGNKSVTDEIKIVREIPWQELLTIVNEGNDCTGFCNTGNRNTGNWNTGNRNTGNWNTGNCNTGNCNTGSCNTGDCNTGNRNTGNWNTGNCNTGDKNTGDWNAGNWNTGFFNTNDGVLFAFNKPLKMSRSKFLNNKGVKILNWNYENNWWIYSQNMTDEEKAAHPEHTTTGGYLKTVSFKEACKIMWDKLTDKEKAEVTKIPNFDSKIFQEITGIKVEMNGGDDE